MSGARIALIVFAKPPRPRQAKTRLAAVLGDEAVTELARAFILDTWSIAASLQWADPVLATTEVDDPFWAELPGARVWAQGEGDLGARMERMLARALETHPAAILIGGDVPSLPPAALNQARAVLACTDVVIGPAEDGGYYLIGFRGSCPAGVFEGLEWSTDHTCRDTEAALRSRGLSISRVAPWFDIDGLDDLRRLARQGEDGRRRAAPETARVLERLRFPPSPGLS